jgi:uncharacterized Zn finger protein
MKKDRHSVADYLNPEAIHHLAIPSNIRLGEEIVAAGGVELGVFTPLEVTAKVHAPGGERRTVSFLASETGLIWRCSCTTNQDLFCKHCVAAAHVTWEKSPGKIN